jgi:hypothetical protein
VNLGKKLFAAFAAIGLLTGGVGDATRVAASGKPLTIKFSPSETTVTEGQSATFTMIRSGGNGKPSKVVVQTSDGSFNKILLPGSTFQVPIPDNNVADGNRDITLSAITTTGTTSSATIHVVDNDSAPPTPPTTPTWSFCAADPGVCTTTASANVRYGVNNSWIIKSSTGAIQCGGLDVWGADPAQGMFKHCETDGTPVLPVTGCSQPMTYQGITACTEVNFTTPPNEETDIPDNVVGGIETIPGGGAINQFVPDDAVGAWRVFGRASWVGRADPIKFFGQPGAGHLHTGICNSLPNGANTDYNLLRTTGTSTCGSLARVGIWMPSMIDVTQQVVKLPKKVYYYYKQLPPGHPDCVNPATRKGICTDLPLGHKWIWGYDMGSMSGGLTDPNTTDWWLQGYYCSDPIAPGHYHTLKEVADAGCPIGAKLNIVFWGPDCYDGNIDSTNHRSHVAYTSVYDGTKLVCDVQHPYLMPEMQFNWEWDVTSDLHNWCLSSDIDMINAGHPVVCGTTLHMDYWNGWSKTVRDRWEQCIRKWLSCSNGDFGDGTAMVGGDAGGIFPSTVDIPLSQLQGGTIIRP